MASVNFLQTPADAPQTPDEYRLLPSEQALSSLQLTHPLWKGLISLSLSERLDPPDGDSIKRTTIGDTQTIPLGGYHSLQVQAEAGDEDGPDLAQCFDLAAEVKRLPSHPLEPLVCLRTWHPRMK